MKISLFGKTLFEYNSSKGLYLLNQAVSEQKSSKYLPDFYVNFNNRGNESFTLRDYITTTSPDGAIIATKDVGTPQPAPAKKERRKFTPKEVFNFKMLNDKGFKINVDTKYVDDQLETFKDKLALIKTEEYDMRNGTIEIASIVARLENRKKYAKHKDFFEEYPYTTTEKINGLIKAHDYLKMGQVAEFLADMPKDAVATMKMYNEYTGKVCSKQAVFYIIADKKDFQKTEKRRDPILLAQSPFGHFWQILGAWDKEMMLLEEL